MSQILVPAAAGRTAWRRLVLPWLGWNRPVSWLHAHTISPWPQGHVLVWSAVLLVLGVFLAVQLQTKPAVATAAGMDSSRQIGATTIHRLEEEQTSLKRQIAQLRVQIQEQEQAAALRRTNVGDLPAVVEAERVAAGLVALKGAGLKLVTDDTTLKTIAPTEDANRYIIHEYELRDIVNVLWAAGAEAISINDERLVTNSSIYCVGTTILVNNTRMSPPYEIRAIGDVVALEDTLGDANVLRSFKESVTRHNLVFSVSRQRELTVPAYSGGFNRRYAAPGADRY